MAGDAEASSVARVEEVPARVLDMELLARPLPVLPPLTLEAAEAVGGGESENGAVPAAVPVCAAPVAERGAVSVACREPDTRGDCVGRKDAVSRPPLGAAVVDGDMVEDGVGALLSLARGEGRGVLVAEEAGEVVRTAAAVVKGVAVAARAEAVGAGAVPVTRSEAVGGAEALLTALADATEALDRGVDDGTPPEGVTRGVPVTVIEGESTELADSEAGALCAAVPLLRLLAETTGETETAALPDTLGEADKESAAETETAGEGEITGEGQGAALSDGVKVANAGDPVEAKLDRAVAVGRIAVAVCTVVKVDESALELVGLALCTAVELRAAPLLPMLV